MNPRRTPRYTKFWLVPVLLGAGVIVVLGGRLLVAGHEAIGAAESALARGDRVEAARSYLDALRCYVPGSPFEGRALDGLDALASAAADAGDSEGERRVLEAVRTGLLGARSFFVPGQAHLAKANRRLAELDAAAVFPPVVRPAIVVAPRIRGWGSSGGPHTPVAGPTLIALAGFATWVGAIVLFIRRALRWQVDADARAVRASVVLPNVLVPVLFVVGFTLFLVGLRLA